MGHDYQKVLHAIRAAVAPVAFLDDVVIVGGHLCGTPEPSLVVKVLGATLISSTRKYEWENTWDIFTWTLLIC